MSRLPPHLIQRSSRRIGAFSRGLLVATLSLLVLIGLSSCGDPVADGTAFSSDPSANGGGSGDAAGGNPADSAPGAGIPQRDDSLPRILVLVSDLAEPFRAVQAGMIGGATDTASFNLDFVDGFGDKETQLKQLNEAISQRPAVLGIFPHTASSIVEPLKQAAEAGIPVVLLSKPPEGAIYTASLYTDQQEIGRVAGEFVLQRLRIKMDREQQDGVFATLFEITGTSEDDCSQARSAGFHSVFDDMPGVQLLHQAPGFWNEADAAKSMAQAVHIQGRADVVFCHSDAMAHGAYLAASKLGEHTNTLFMGIDGVGGGKGGIAKVRDQMLAGTVSVPLLGAEIAEMLSTVAKGETPAQKDQMVAPELVTIANSSAMFEKHSQMGMGAAE